MKLFISLILLIQSITVLGFSFVEIPLNKMIDDSEFICRGKIIDIQKTDSLLLKELLSIIGSDGYKLGDPNCGYCSEIATFAVTKTIKGQILKDTVLIPFHRDPWFALPGFEINQECIVFLDNLIGPNIFAKTDPRFGLKSSHLEEYERLINEYLLLDKVQVKNWILNLCIHPNLSWEGTLNLKSKFLYDLDENEKELLSKGLIDMDFNDDNYINLLEIVSDFGKNDLLIDKCFNRLIFIENEDVNEGLEWKSN